MVYSLRLLLISDCLFSIKLKQQSKFFIVIFAHLRAQAAASRRTLYNQYSKER